MSVAINSSPAGALNQGSYNNKRRASEDESELQADSKRTRYSWYFTLERESPEPSSEDTESILTVQDYETEYARDTSDTSTHTWVSDSDYERDIALLEYEVDSTSDNNHMYNSLSSSSEPENILAVEFITFCESEGMADDSDVSKCSTDCEPRVSAFKTCVQCNSPNNSLYQYCRKCFQERKTYFPRPRRKPRSSSKSSKKSDRTATTATRTPSSTSPVNSQELVEMDSGIGSSQIELELATSTEEIARRHRLRSSGNLSAFGSLTSETSTTTESPRASEVPSSQSSELTIFASQDSVLPTSESQDSALPESQSSEMLESQSQDSALPESQDSALPESQNSEVSMPRMSASQSNELLGSQTSVVTMTSLATTVATSQESLNEVDSGLTLKDEQCSSQDSVNSEKQDDGEEAEITIRTLLKRLQKLEKEGSASSMLCITCFENKRDSVFNHGKTGHQCCCYKCAKKVCMSNRNRCPMCNRRVSSITKIFLD